ncbi:MAG TPA: DNA-3-methyladenine glycosylase [Gemmatimonadaceae bacterium]|nr:DNA-3-methyladenine glycosylase [Gemmatimonadaceae bacterium]
MASTPTLRKAVSHLKKADPVMAKLIAEIGPCRYEKKDFGSHFDALCRSIIYQQLSTKAAGTIHGRFLDLFPSRRPTPEALLAIPEETLRGVGLSRQKLNYLRDLAEKVHTGALPLDHLDELPDDEIITYLVQVKGIGVWTAQMFLMFQLRRLDVLPDLDLGIRNAIKRAYRVRGVPDARRIARIGAPWRPYASIACWYLWRSLD